MFKCLDKHKRKASVLFLNIDIENQPKDLFIRLLRDYSDIFDFNMINLKTILNTTSELTKELITIKEDYEEKINEMKQIIIEQKEEIKKFNESRSLIDNDFKKLIEDQKEIISEQKKQIDLINESIEKKLNDFILNQEQKSEGQKKEINKLIEQQKNEINRIENEQKQKINKINEDQMKEINKLIEQQKNEIKRNNEEQNSKINRINDEQSSIRNKLQSTASTQQIKDEISNQTKNFITKQISIHMSYQI